jgi:hypothetical protein
VAEVEFFDEKFEPAGLPSEFSMWELADAGADGEGNLMTHRAVMMQIAREVIGEKDWQRFRLTARKNRADIDQLTAFISEAMRSVADDLPTERPSVSSDGPPVIEQKSETRSVVTVLAERFPGRPDLWAGLEGMAEAKTQQKTG